MKKLGRFWLILILLLGVCAGVLRGIEVSAHFDWDTALYEPFSAAFVLPLYAALSLVLIAAVSAAHRGALTDFRGAYPLGKTGLFIAAMASLGLCAAGLWKLFAAMTALKAVQIILGIMTILGGAALLVLAMSRVRGIVPEPARFLASFAVFWGCFLLVVTYMEHPVEPVIRNFVYDILAACAIVFALFWYVAPLFRKADRGKSLFFSLAGVYLVLLTAVGRVTAFLLSGEQRNLTDAPFRMLLFICVGVLMLQNAATLLRQSGSTGTR